MQVEQADYMALSSQLLNGAVVLQSDRALKRLLKF